MRNPCNVITSEIINEDTFKFVDGACYKIIREWAVIDWCVYKPNTGAEDNFRSSNKCKEIQLQHIGKNGYYRYTQILKVVDLIPTIAVEDQVYRNYRLLCIQCRDEGNCIRHM
ncbi:MAG: hypothetical protein IPH57_09145 [Saprospiraceae bacterium]|nr:hypothetical protein [Saprospiraceae bacterium]